MRRIAALMCAAVLLSLAAQARAQVDEPTEVVNDEFHFAFTVEGGSFVAYPEDGNGFKCIHNPAGGGPGTQPDYGMLVFGGYLYVLSAEQAAAAKLDPPEETVLTTADVHNNTRFSDLVKGAMSAYDREPAGEAVIGVEGGSSIRVPYFVWSRTVGTQTKHALMYSVVHGDGFVNVQVESSRPFTKQQIAWFTTKLRLLELPVVVEDNGSPVEGAGAAEGT